jgi:hypothetical protein
MRTNVVVLFICRHGQGRMEWMIEGNQYTGQWIHGLQHGIGLDSDRQGHVLHQGHYFEGKPVSKVGPRSHWEEPY